MSKQKELKTAIAILLVGLIFIGCKNLPSNSMTAQMPNNHGAELARTQCVACHEMDLISSQRLSKAGWTREVEKMMRWGAEIKDADKEHLVDYLATTYTQRPFSKEPPPSPAPTPDPASVARGKTTFESKCLACHQDELMQQQRLGKTGWTREVEKMTRWGAEIKDTEKDSLIDFLTVQFPAKKKA